MGFTTINDAWEAFQRLFGADLCPWTADEFRAYRFAQGTRYEDIDGEWLDDAFNACVDHAAREAGSLRLDDAADGADEGTPIVLRGHAAIDYAAAHGRTLRKLADPTEGARDGLTVDEARAVARDDDNLIRLEVARCASCAAHYHDPGMCDEGKPVNSPHRGR